MNNPKPNECCGMPELGGACEDCPDAEVVAWSKNHYKELQEAMKEASAKATDAVRKAGVQLHPKIAAIKNQPKD